MTSRLDALHELSELHRSGTITDAEFQEQKNKLFAESSSPTETLTTDEVATRIARLSPAWKRKFAFFREYGSPFSSESRAAFTSLSFWDRRVVAFNLWAFVFGPFYYWYLGIPKRGLGIVGIWIAVGIVLSMVGASEGLYVVLGYVANAIFAALVNYSYYIRVSQGRDEWDPLKDFRTA